MPPVIGPHVHRRSQSGNGNLELLIGPDSSGNSTTGGGPPQGPGRLGKGKFGGGLRRRTLPPYHEAVKVVLPFKDGDICYMHSKDGKFGYAICKQWPGSYLILKGVRAPRRN